MMIDLKRLAAILMASALFALAGCAGTGEVESETTAEEAGQAEGEESGVETGGMDASEREFQGNPLDNPDSPLSTRVIHFEFDSSTIQKKYLDILDAHAEYLMDNPDTEVRLEGHADERGSREYNIGLGDRRAQAVRRLLLFQGVEDDQVSTVSYGEEQPVDPGHNEEAWAKNRRVEIVYLR